MEPFLRSFYFFFLSSSPSLPFFFYRRNTEYASSLPINRNGGRELQAKEQWINVVRFGDCVQAR